MSISLGGNGLESEDSVAENPQVICQLAPTHNKSRNAKLNATLNKKTSKLETRTLTKAWISL